MLALIHLPVPAQRLDPMDRRDLAVALQEIGRDLAIRATGQTLIIPTQERTAMKVSLDLSGPSGKMWSFDMEYHRLPPEYAGEVGAAASAFAAYLNNLTGGASNDDPKYSMKFSYKGEGDGPLAKGQGNASGLLYSEAVGAQKAGIKLLEKLLLGADMEIASGQRK